MRISALMLLALTACGSNHEDDAILAVHDTVSEELTALHTASTALCAAAPAPDADGWNATDDASAVQAMRGHWKQARIAYERIEGAIAVLFPDLDAATDERYDGFLGDGADPDLFDGEGVTGVHAIERILWADSHTETVRTFEAAIPGYSEAAFPTTEAEATSFRDGLCAQLVTDVHTMHMGFADLALDPAAAFDGVTGSMAEQAEKIDLGESGEAESRYARHTLADMRANLEGGRAIYSGFSEWIADNDPDVDAEVLAGFDRVTDALNAVSGEALPDVPEGWNPDAPDAAHLDTPYGKLWTAIHADADPDAEGSLVDAMVRAAAAVDIAVAP